MAERRILRAWLDSWETGTVELAADWTARGGPPLEPVGRRFRVGGWRRLPAIGYGMVSGFCVERPGTVLFVLDPRRLAELPLADDAVFVAGDFNGWDGVGREAWRMLPMERSGRRFLGCEAPLADLGVTTPRFKFVTAARHWVEVPWDAPNVVVDGQGNRNHQVVPDRTGSHLWQFQLGALADLAAENQVRWRGTAEVVDVRPGPFFFDLKTDLPLGAVVGEDGTTFRLFAPRAKRAQVACFQTLRDGANAEWREMEPRDIGVWELRVPENLHGWYYWFRLHGPRNAFSAFDPALRILDPWAQAAAASGGPAIVIDKRRYPRPARTFRAPQWQDLVVVEGHVRDLTAKAPIELSVAARRGFVGLARWLAAPDTYLARLGANALELQPVQEFDDKSPEEYHWGYMPTAWFAPESQYGTRPEAATQVPEMRSVVDACHRRGWAVILDVVYNHVGEPNSLHAMDKLYWFEVGEDGMLTNWSGCGNDLRANAAMARRLIIESCRHWLEFYDVDGFRFDLAELIGVEVLREVEAELKKVRPDVILIAEPWSFRGHIAAALRPTGWASWNDSYRDFVREYVQGRGTAEGIEYFLKGSPWHFARWPAQTVNYTESHDDRSWIDRITENAGSDGTRPTPVDVARTHLMLALLFSSVGLPMLAAGQDFLRSKAGVSNTYQRGDLNALDYRRLVRHAATHEYAARWIRFRLGGGPGRLLRQYTRPTDGFFSFHFAQDRTAFAAVYNADGSAGAERLLLAVNPHPEDVVVRLPAAVPRRNWRQVADHAGFFDAETARARWPVAAELWLPGLSCALWSS